MLVLALVLLAGCGRAGNHGLGQTFKSLASISAEGALMAGDVADGRSKTTFVRVHGADLSAQAEHEAEKLNDVPVAPKRKPPVESAVKLAGDIGGAIDDLRVSPQDRQQAREAQLKLEHWAKEMEGLVEQL